MLVSQDKQELFVWFWFFRVVLVPVLRTTSASFLGSENQRAHAACVHTQDSTGKRSPGLLMSLCQLVRQSVDQLTESWHLGSLQPPVDLVACRLTFCGYIPEPWTHMEYLFASYQGEPGVCLFLSWKEKRWSREQTILCICQRRYVLL